jgi:hypothetical protein
MLRALALAAVAVPASSCATDLECSLNGICDTTSGVCACDKPWIGDSCGQLSISASTNPGPAYGGATPFDVTTWGGNAIEQNGTWHAYFTELVGDGCGLHAWKDQSTVTYAVSNDPLGPFVKQHTVLTREAHNPEVVLFNDSWYIFHIGYKGAPPLKTCHETVPPTSWKSSIGTKEAELQETKEPPPWPASGQIHKSSSPDGPFTAVKLPKGWKNCNNPSPFVTKNGTVRRMFISRLMATPHNRTASRPRCTSCVRGKCGMR